MAKQKRHFTVARQLVIFTQFLFNSLYVKPSDPNEIELFWPQMYTSIRHLLAYYQRSLPKHRAPFNADLKTL